MNGLSVSHCREVMVVRILMHMRNRNLRSPLKRATDMATATLSDIAEGMGRKLRTLQAYRSGRCAGVVDVLDIELDIWRMTQ